MCMMPMPLCETVLGSIFPMGLQIYMSFKWHKTKTTILETFGKMNKLQQGTCDLAKRYKNGDGLFRNHRINLRSDK